MQQVVLQISLALRGSMVQNLVLNMSSTPTKQNASSHL
jgi:hypothetical protein